MSLIKCKECEKEISKTVKRCPNCGEQTEYGKKTRKKLIIVLSIILLIITGIIICDRAAILKSCDDGDEKRGSICIKKHYSDPQYEEKCVAGAYVKDGRCYIASTGMPSSYPTKKYYCNSGYLEEKYTIKKCVVETTYNAYYRFNFDED